MTMTQDVILLGTINTAILEYSRKICFKVDWMHEKFSRVEEPLIDGRLCTLPYLFRRKAQMTYTPEQDELISHSLPIVDEIKKMLPELIPVRGEVVNLLPGKQLSLHIDQYWFHKHSRRIHVPIYTNKDCFQIFEDRETHLEVGNVYEINNRIMHSARNSGTEPRFHLIVDLMDKEHYDIAINDKIAALRVDL